MNDLMENKLIEQQEIIKAMQENEDSAIKVMQMYKECKKRIEKAIEYINRFELIKAYYEYQDGEYWETDYDDDFQKELLEILKGEDKE